MRDPDSNIENDDDDTGSDNDNDLTVEPANQWSAARLFQASYKDLGNPVQVQERFTQHVLHHCEADLKQLLQESSATTRDYSICIDAFDLIQADPVLGVLLIRYPATLLPLLESAIVRAQQALQQQRQELEEASTQQENIIPQPTWSAKGGTAGNEQSTATTRVHARLVHLPPTCCKVSLGRCLAAQDVGKIWQVSGTVVRTGPVQMYESARTYKCCGVNISSSGGWKGGRGGGRGRGRATRGENASDQHQTQEQPYCGRTFLVHADVEQRNNALLDPEICPGSLPNGDRCPGNKFELVEGGSVHTDYQEIKIQDAASSSAGGVGHIPRSLLIKLQHDLVDHCQPGDEVVVVGILLAQWQHPGISEGMECHVSMAMSAQSVRVICEKGSSVWKGGSGMGRADNSIGERDQFEKEFLQYWSETENVKCPIAARDFICKAVCAKLYGMQVIKLGLLLTLIGGVSSDVYEDHGIDHEATLVTDASLDSGQTTYSRDNEPETFQLLREVASKKTTVSYHDEALSAQTSTRPEKVKTRRRDQSHCLLVGDPGTGKSQFLRFAATLCPRSVLTTGVGTTSAGLTCAAVREGSGKEFALEAGALVLADKGVCCIDEFGCIRESDRTTIHEAMEQQTLSVAKAGIVCKLNCRATIIAVMNPRNCLYDNHSSLAANTGLGTPLLSRFDLIFKLVDTSDAERDNNVTTYLLNRAILGAGFDSADLIGNDASQTDRTPWNMVKLRAYISVVKDRFQPAMSDDAAFLLERHYEKCRSTPCNTIPVTVRFLESLIRLSQAHARLMHRICNTVTLQDAVAVIQVMECTAFAYGGFDGVGVVDSLNVMYRDPMTIDFSEEPDLDFLCFEYRLLERYNMLGSMDSNRKSKALLAFGTAVRGSVGDPAWHDLENGQFSNTGKRNHSIERASQPSMTQDHYGRFHYGSSQSQNKRRRP